MKKLRVGDRVRGRQQWLKPQAAQRRRPPPTLAGAEPARPDRRGGTLGQATPPRKERGKDMVKQFVTRGARRARSRSSRDTEAMINARIAQIDHLISLQLNEIMHAPEFQKLEGDLARPQATCSSNSETERRCSRSRSSTSRRRICCGPAAGARVRPERAVQEGLRGGVRRLRRRAVRRARRRLRVRQVGPGHRAAGEDLAGGGRGARAVPHRRVARDVQPGELHPARRAARPGQDLRHHRVREVEGVPRRAKTRATSALTLPRILMREPYGTRHRAGRGVQLRGGRRRHRPRQVPVGQRRLGAGGARRRRRSRRTAGAPRSAAWRAAAWSKVCRCTTSRPTTGDVAMKCPTEIADHRPPREGAGGPGLRPAGALQGHRLRGVLQRAVGAEAQGLRHATRPRRTRASRRSCRTSSPSRASRTT